MGAAWKGREGYSVEASGEDFPAGQITVRAFVFAFLGFEDLLLADGAE